LRVIILSLLAAAALAVQDTPDFSGRWVLVAIAPAGDEIARVLVVRQSLVRTNVRGEPMTPYFKDIAIDRQFDAVSRSETFPIGVVGGFVAGIAKGATPPSSRGHHVVKWDGSALVFEHGTYTGDTRQTGTWAERREVWSLEPDGRLRAVTTTRSSVDVSGSTVTLIYQRVPLEATSSIGDAEIDSAMADSEEGSTGLKTTPYASAILALDR